MVEYTGIRDKNGVKIYVGSRVKKSWGWWAHSGEDIREHIITKHIENNLIRYNLGNSFNRWTGKEVEVIENLENVKEHRCEKNI